MGYTVTAKIGTTSGESCCCGAGAGVLVLEYVYMHTDSSSTSHETSNSNPPWTHPSVDDVCVYR